MTRHGRVSGLLAACLLSLLAAACNKPLTVEQQIVAVIRNMESHMEASERRPFMDYIAEDFSGQNGQMNYPQLNAYMLYNLRRYDRLQAQVFPIRVVDLGDGRAEAHFKALITGGPGWLPDSGQILEISTQWQRREDEWQVVSAKWDPLPIEKMLP